MVPAMVYVGQKRVPGKQNGVEMLMHRAWVTHHHCPLALEQSVMGGAGINVNQKNYIKQIIKFLKLFNPLWYVPHVGGTQSWSCGSRGRVGVRSDWLPRPTLAWERDVCANLPQSRMGSARMQSSKPIGQ